ncbi:GHKL domain-containing protein [Flavobacterium sp. xlx-214]|uniref:ATP-binding protein n=1 Tax=unclassified Flavobacterium TaxID=196869 RepID=UPI0013D80B7F|nr:MULTISPECIES: ATP-binding protein [unclassified Flavobacterium]MBA5791942.1 GHKL domain-containing protein [Flavobacterium sp. xlx-221]QMI84197.1 GHKL domain-containing protein [Flavobacterium sp. xlx-214]
MAKPFSIQRTSLRIRIFISMIFLIIVSSVLIAMVTIYQFKKEARNYHQDRLERKESAVNEHVNFILQTTKIPASTENLPLIFKDKIYELSTIHNIQINIYDLKGNLLITSKGNFIVDKMDNEVVSPIILKIIESTASKRFVDLRIIDGITYRSSYNYIKDVSFKPLGIISMPYAEETSFYDNQVESFLIHFGQIYIFMFVLAIVLAYVLSSYITKTIKLISERIQLTNINQKNEKIKVSNASYEIEALIVSYNEMVDKLEESADKLAQSQRELAWREMAKQVAHEIKNPLTPMKLTVQSFARRFNPEDPKIDEKMKDFCDTMVQQIDTMSAVASAFSNFASMPAQENTTLNVVKVVQLALDIFNEDFIRFESTEKEIIAVFDQSQIIRIITNLVKNAIQAIPNYEPFPRILVKVEKVETDVLITISDNGTGVPDSIKDKIFEPKFTTKTSGMGLGLAMIKNMIEGYGGTIYFETQVNKGTTFYVQLPITN